MLVFVAMRVRHLLSLFFFHERERHLPRFCLCKLFFVYCYFFSFTSVNNLLSSVALDLPLYFYFFCKPSFHPLFTLLTPIQRSSVHRQAPFWLLWSALKPGNMGHAKIGHGKMGQAVLLKGQNRNELGVRREFLFVLITIEKERKY